MKRVVKLYKKVGETPLEALERVRKERGIAPDVPMTYAGRLDPMAEGLLLVLVGDECKRKEKYLELDKEYEFSLLLGVSTDTSDMLGLPNLSMYRKVFEMREVERVLKEFIGKQEWEYPVYSSKTVEGKSLWWWAREGKTEEIEIPTREIEIYSVDFERLTNISSSELLRYIVVNANKVKGDFRQEEVIERWREVLEEETTFQVIEGRIRCSSGTYIRALAHKVGERLGVGGVLCQLNRTRIGSFALDI